MQSRLISLVITLFFFLPSYAEEKLSNEKPIRNEEQSTKSVLPSIVVSATRNEQVSNDLPVSIDSIDKAIIQDNSSMMINLSESLIRVPGLVVQNRQNYAQDLQISSRGFGARSAFGVRGVRLYADGIPATMPDGQGQTSNFDLASADHIEVLRGPFSALYGNSSGGVISIFTEDGKPGTTLSPSLRMGSFGTQQSHIKLSGQQNGLNYVVNAMRFDTDGYRQHSSASRNTENVKLRLTPSDDSIMTVIANAVTMPNIEDPLGLTRSQYEADPRNVTPTAISFNTRKTVRQHQFGFHYEKFLDRENIVHVTGYGGERSTTQYQAIPISAQIAPSSAGGVIDLSRQYQGLDLRWQYQPIESNKLQWTAGLSIDNLDEDRLGYENFIGLDTGVKGRLRRDEANKAYNIDQYIQVLWEPSQHWLLLAGIRNSNIRVRSDDHYITTENGNDSGDAEYRALMPVLGATYKLNDKINLYASYGRGFETPTLNELSYRSTGAGFNFSLQPARSDHIEAGIKAQFDAHLQFALAVFHINTTDELTVLSNIGGRSIYQNAGKTKREGIEFEWKAKWPNGVESLLSYTLLKAIYANSFCNMLCTSTTQVSFGNRLPGIPKQTAYGELSWRHTPSGFSTAIEGKYNGKIYVDDINSDATSSYFIANIRFNLEQKIKQWKIQEFLRIDNITNRDYIGSVIVNEGNARFFEPAAGRNFVAGITLSHLW